MPVAAAYISELSKAEGRGRFFLLYEMIFPVRLMMTGQIAALVVPLLGWKIMFLIAGIPGLIVSLLLLRLPESPRWLMTHGREEALVYAGISGVPGEIPGPGYRVIAAARLADGAIVAVDRGFIPEGHIGRNAGALADAVPQMTGSIEITGIMRWPERRGYFAPKDDPARNLWFMRDHLAIVAAKGWSNVNDPGSIFSRDVVSRNDAKRPALLPLSEVRKKWSKTAPDEIFPFVASFDGICIGFREIRFDPRFSENIACSIAMIAYLDVVDVWTNCEGKITW